jgi:predicted dehydrogenase
MSRPGPADGAGAPPLRWGVIGTGQIAGVFADDLAHSRAGDVVAVGSRSLATAVAFADRHGVARAHGSYDALLADPGIDAVYVATPHPMHRDNALAAVAAGRPVLVEKAFTMTAKEASEVAAASRSAGVFAMEAMWTRFLPHVVEIRRLVAGGALGALVSVSADFGEWFAPDPGARLFAPDLGGGALHDLGVYPVSFASMLLGRPERVLAAVEPAFTGVDGLVSAVLTHRGGAHALVSAASSARGPGRAVIVGTEAWIDIEPPFYAPTSFTLTDRHGKVTPWSCPHDGTGHRHQAEEVARCVAAGMTESDVMPLQESVTVVETLERILAAGGDVRDLPDRHRRLTDADRAQ